MTIEYADIQAVVLRGYPTLKAARFLLIQFEEVERVRLWLRRVLSMVTPFRCEEGQQPKDRALNVALGRHGLQALGLPNATLSQFARPFREGMTAPHRSRGLGDHGINDPQRWMWGGSREEEPDLLLLCYGAHERIIDEMLASLNLFPECDSVTGIKSIQTLDTTSLPDRKEHFGFRDGVSQPKIVELERSRTTVTEGASERGAERETETLKADHGEPSKASVRLGEFVLGYQDEYGEYPRSPAIDLRSIALGTASAHEATLSRHPNRVNHVDFGKNGTYLVFRQIQQQVTQFWRFIKAQGRLLHHPDPEASELLTTHWLAAKMVGRWSDGTPLTLSPHYPPPATGSDSKPSNQFSYHQMDRFGYGCPLGAHIRRSNPRDSLPPDPGGSGSWAINRRHRIMRRGRPFGPPLVETLAVEDLLNAPDDGLQRGLHFLCFNAHIERQFEFVQQSWINNKKFADLYNDADPLIGDHDPREEGVEGQFTLQAEPVRERVTGLSNQKPFTQLLGGGYFFMPGIAALSLLLDLRDDPKSMA